MGLGLGIRSGVCFSGVNEERDFKADCIVRLITQVPRISSL